MIIICVIRAQKKVETHCGKHSKKQGLTQKRAGTTCIVRGQELPEKTKERKQENKKKGKKEDDEPRS